MSSPERRQALPGVPEKFNQFSTLSGPPERTPPVPGSPEGVDAARRALYKTGNGGGRNPAAAVL